MWNFQRLPFYVKNPHHYNNFFGRVQTCLKPKNEWPSWKGRYLTNFQNGSNLGTRPEKKTPKKFPGTCWVYCPVNWLPLGVHVNRPITRKCSKSQSHMIGYNIRWNLRHIIIRGTQGGFNHIKIKINQISGIISTPFP